MKKILLLIFCLLILAAKVWSQSVNVNGVTAIGRFVSCTGASSPNVTANLISTNGGASISSVGGFICLNSCDSSTLRITLSNIRWNRVPNSEWLHGLFLPASAGFTVSPVTLPPGFIAYNQGCVGTCPSGSGTNGGPGFYFDNTVLQSCCTIFTVPDGVPCNNYGNGGLGCNTPFTLAFDLKFCNSIITGSSYQFVLRGTSDGETGCWDIDDSVLHTISFTIPTVPCAPINIAPTASNPVRTCVGPTINYTSTLSGTCSGNNIYWWDAPTGGNLIGSGSPFIYDPAGSACPSGTILYASCCSNGQTGCIGREAVTIPGSCDIFTLNGVTTTNSTCSLLGAINSTSVSNAQGTVNYSLSPSGTANTTGIFNGLSQSSYTISASDASGCTVTSIISIAQPPAITFNAASITNPLCSSPNSGSISISASGGSGAVTYGIAPSAIQSQSGTFTGLSGQNYTITATDATTCAATTIINVALVPTLIWSSFTSNNLNCFNNSSGGINSSVSGGSGSISYVLSGTSNQSNTSGIFSGLNAGNYTVTSTDANGCSVTSAVSITQPTLLSWSSVASTNVLCNGGNTASITSLATGGTTVYSYNLLPGNITNATGLFSNLVAGTYTVKATDANGCTVTSAVAITQPTLLAWSSVVKTNVLCNGGNTASITSLATGGTTVYSYNLLPGNITNGTGSFSNLVAGTYTVKATDANGCSVTSAVAITQPTLLAWSSVNKTNVLCNGGNTASITSLATGGTTVYSYNLLPGNITNGTGLFSNLVAGTYTVKATDANGCTVTSAVSITQPTLLSWSSVVKNNVLCNGGTNASINSTAIGGTTAYSYNLLPGNITNGTGSFSNLVAGTYTVKATDANGCTVTSAVAITQPTLLAWSSVVKTNVLCNGGNTASITSLATGGTTVYSYNLLPGNITNATGSFSNLVAGIYTVKATDANGCSITSAVSVIQPTILSLSTTPANVTCFGGTNGSIASTATGGTTVYSYNLLPGNITNGTGLFSNLVAGTYTVKATDANGCTVTSAVSITQPTLLSWSSVVKNNVLCNGGTNASINSTAIGGTTAYSYNLLPGNITNGTGSFSNLVAGTYTVKATDANGCTVTSAVAITQPTLLAWSSVVKTNVLCNGGNTASITSLATGGTTVYSYNLLPGNITNATGSFSNLVAGIYTVKATDANGCSITSAVSVIQPTILSLSTTPANVTCFGGTNGSIASTATGGTTVYSYNLLPGNITNGTGLFSNLVAGTYTVKATDANGCTVTSAVSITQPTLLSWSSVVKNNVLCNGGTNASINSTAIGGTTAYSYNLLPGNITNGTGSFSNLVAGTYTVKATDANGCTVTSAVAITQPTLLAWSSVVKTNVLCHGGNTASITSLATGGTTVYSYNLLPGNITNATGSFSNLVAGIYTVKATDANGCSITSAVSVIQPTILSLSTTPANVTCFGGTNGSIASTATGGTTVYSYNLLPGNITNGTGLFSNLVAGTYTVKATDANGCTITSAVAITQPLVLSFTSTTPANVTCFGGTNGSIASTATGGTGALSYKLLPTNITNASGTFPNVTASNYTVQATDASGCSVSTAIVITQPTQLTWTSNTATNVLCNLGTTGSIASTATGGTGTITYKLLPTNTTNTSGTFGTLTVNSYTIQATDANNCSITTTLNITQPTAIVWNTATQVNISCQGGTDGSITQTATGGTGILTYKLLPANTTNTTGIFLGLTAGAYTVQVTDANNCTKTTLFTLTQPSALNITNVTSTIPTCVPGSDATMTITANGGTPIYQYNIGSTNQASNIFTSLGASVYTITVTDAKNCTKTSTYSIITPNAPTITSTTPANVTCFGGTNGSIASTATGGTGALSYKLLPTNITNASGLFNGLDSNSYSIIVTDASGCSVSTSSAITHPSQIIWSQIDTVHILCFAGNNGSISVIAAGGTGAMTYNLLPGNVSNSSGIFNSLIANSYTITATDANSCSIATTIQITQPPLLIWNTNLSINVSCFNGNNGSITSNATGGTGTITYNIQPGNISNNTGAFNTLVATNYTITAIDANNCSISTSVIITEPTQMLIASITSTIPTCVPGSDATMTVTATGGTTSYSYSIGTGTQTSNVFTNLGPATYTIVVSDANSCTVSSTITIASPNSPTIPTATNTSVLCFNGTDGTIQVGANGGTGILNYNLLPTNINNLTGNYIGLNANNYTVNVTDAVGCSASTAIVITQPTELIINSATAINVSCNAGSNGSITANATGGTGTISYNLLPNSIMNTSGIFTNLNANTYTIVATDANGCSKTSSVQITEPTQVIWNTNLSTNVSCFNGNNGSITSNATGGTGTITYNIQPGNISNNTGAFNTLVATNYTITAIDANNCSISTSVIITEPTQLQIASMSNTIPTCVPGSDATMTVTATGGTTSYSYSIGTGTQTSNVFTNLGPATYTIVVSDANSCTVSSTITIASPNSPSINTATNTSVLCFNGTDGTIQVGASGGTGILNYNLLPTNINNLTGNYIGLNANNYTVNVTDAVGCSASTAIVITQPTELIINSATAINVSCNAGSNGSITANATGGTGTISYNLLPNSIMNTSGIFTNLNANTYTIVATDANGCSKTSSVQITEPTQVIWNTNLSTNVSCFNGNNGSITSNATGGTGTITYNIQPGNISNNTGAFNTLVATNYTITAIDANNCSISTSVIITEPTQMLIASISSTIPSCVPGSDAIMTITANGGTTSYSYSIGTGTQTSNVFTNLNAGNFTIIVTDANSCTVSSVHNIILPNSPLINSIATTNASCVPGGDATATVNASGGNGSITFSIDGINFQSSNILSNLSASNYTVVAKDAFGCTVSSVITINTQPSPTINSILTTIASCLPGCDANASVSASGGASGVFTYSIDGINFQSNNQFLNLCATNYTMTVKDGNGCTASTLFSISTANAPIINSVTANNISCFSGLDGSISVTTTGGFGTINYTLLANGTTNTTGLFAGLDANTYTINTVDANGCSVTTISILTEPAILQFSNITSSGSLCSGSSNGQIDVSMTGGTAPMLYVISPIATFNPPATFTGLLGNLTYTITSTDANNCSISTTVFVTQPTSIIINTTSITDVTCNGQADGSILVNASGGTGTLTYLLNPTNQTNTTGLFSNLNGNSYTVTITDANNCSVSTTLNLFEPTVISQVSLTASDITCHNLNDGTIQLNCIGGVGVLSYNIQPNNLTNTNGNFNALMGNAYTITATDTNGCVFTTTQIIDNPSLLLIDSIHITNITCSGQTDGMFQVYGSGGILFYNYSINPNPSNNGTGIFNNLSSSIYTVTLTDANSCTATSLAQIIEPSPIIVNLVDSNNVTCFGGNNGSITANAVGGTGGFTYTLLPSGSTNTTGVFTGLIAGTYTIQATDINNCSATFPSLTLTSPTQIIFTAISHTDVTCHGDSTGTINVSALGGIGAISFGLSPNAGIQNNPGAFINLYSSNYIVTATDALGCFSTLAILVDQNPPLIFGSINYQEPTCHGDTNATLQVIALGGIGTHYYQLNNGPISLIGSWDHLASGSYMISISDVLGCKKDSLFDLKEPDPVALDSIKFFPITCKDAHDGKAIVKGKGGRGFYTYYMRPGLHINRTGKFQNLRSGIYTLTIKDTNGCTFDTLINIDQAQNLMQVAITQQNLGCLGTGNEGWAQANIVGGEPPYTYTWSTSPAQFTEKANNLFFGSYFVDVTDANGCLVKDTVYIEPGPCCDEVFIPNAFSPNGDGVNDVFKMTTSAGIDLIQLSIFDRWGNKVWNTYDFRASWDGNYKGRYEDMNTFYYVFQYKCLTDGQKYIKKGDVMLVR